MKAGSHHFDFNVDRALFEAFESPDIIGGSAEVSVDLGRTASMLTLAVGIEGEVVVECDRCLEELTVPVSFRGELKVKFSEETDDCDGEIMWISPGDDNLSLALYIYESIVLSLPYSRVHGTDGEGNPLCDADMLDRFRIVGGEEFDRMVGESEPLSEGQEGRKLRELKEMMEKKVNE